MIYVKVKKRAACLICSCKQQNPYRIHATNLNFWIPLTKAISSLIKSDDSAIGRAEEAIPSKRAADSRVSTST